MPCTINGAVQLGSTCENIKRKEPAPATREAVTYSFCSSPNAAARVRRTYPGSPTIPIAIMVLARPGPNTATTATASSSEGKASSTSIKRMIGVSNHRLKNAAINPSTMPGISARPTDTRPINSDSRAPNISRERMSRPASSVPSKKCQEPPLKQAGGILTNSRYCSIGLCGASHGANTATNISTTSNAAATVAPRFFENCFQNARAAGNPPVGGSGVGFGDRDGCDCDTSAANEDACEGGCELTCDGTWDDAWPGSCDDET